ncbi:MAG: hypothetical protein ACUZ8O_01430 [Candidatus Anammoxibacter sp.]
MKITKIFSYDILIFAPLFLCTMIKVIGVPAYFLWYGKSHRFSWQEWAVDILVSPGALNRQRIGQAIQKGYGRKLKKAPKELKSNAAGVLSNHILM